jgi:L-fucose isomerase-like protein
MADVRPLRLGLACLARSRFDYVTARAIYQRSVAALKAFDGVELIAPDDLILDNPDEPVPGLIAKAAAFFSAAQIDAIIIQSGTFTMGDMALELLESLKVPIVLWALPEPDWDGGRLKLNSLVGLNVNSSHLFKMGRPFRYLIASPGDAVFQEKMGRFVRVLRLIAQLRHTKILQAGSRPQGFYDLSYNEMELRAKLGVEVVAVGLGEVFDRARSLPAKQVAETQSRMVAMLDDTSEVSAEKQALQARAYLALGQTASRYGASAIAVRCWPEFPFDFGVAACSAVAYLNDDEVPCGCEGDLEGALTSLIMQSLSGTVPFLADVSGVDLERNALLMWHNGCAALRLAATRKLLHGHFQANRGLTVGFGLQPGPVTLARLGNDGKNLRMLATTGEALPTEMFIRGTMSWVATASSVQRVADELIYGGWEHHLAMAYAGILEDLREFAAITGIPFTTVA